MTLNSFRHRVPPSGDAVISPKAGREMPRCARHDMAVYITASERSERGGHFAPTRPPQNREAILGEVQEGVPCGAKVASFGVTLNSFRHRVPPSGGAVISPNAARGDASLCSA
jgi:hypothetical protein